ncbi:class A sortase [Vagococcus bubulae]|uniref:Class A sortase n=2 Tax=Vagococcus bubulae TaxID=1977868 RepID=A0A429ZK80_9ENTE|nr:class A sortase [Vagococcus bubulae]
MNKKSKSTSKNKSKKKSRKHGHRKKSSSKKNNGFSFLKVGAVVMILLGLGALLYPIVGNYLANRDRSEAVDQYNKEMKDTVQKDIDKNIELAKEYNKEIYANQQGNRNTKKIDYNGFLENQNVMGTIEVPALNIKSLPFYHGTSYKTLDKGLGHFEQSSIPIGGINTRSVITGHSGMKNQVLFSEIRNLKEGDIFFINILGEKLAYEIKSFEEVLPSDIESVAVIPGEDIVTLLTCTPPGINTYRLLVNGHRISYKEAAKKDIVRRNLLSYQVIVLVLLAVCIPLFVVLWLLYRYYKEKMMTKNKKIFKKYRRKLVTLVKVIKMFFIALLIIMIGVLCYAVYGFTQMQQSAEFGKIDVGAQEELYAYNADKILKGNYDEQKIRSVNVSDYAEALGDFHKSVNDWGIGRLVIPSVSIDVPILSGISNTNLLSGAASYRKNQELGKDNYVLMSHNLVGSSALLTDIDKLKKGDKMYATDFKNIYTFDVTVNKVIDETEVDVIKKVPTEQLTLIRCEGDIGTKYRRLVQGKLSNQTSIEDSTDKQLEQVQLVKDDNSDGTVIPKNPITYKSQFGINLASSILSNPVQTAAPLFLLLLFPIIVLGFLR